MLKNFYLFYFIFLISFLSIFLKCKTSNYYYPIKNNTTISSYYGIRELYGKYNFHNGIDIPSIPGTPIYCISDGIVKYIGFDNSGYGNYIIILHNNSYKSLYGHLSENFITSIGIIIRKGQIIAYVGSKILSDGRNNGNTTGPHLHFSVYSNDGKTIDPLLLEYEK